MNSTDFKPEHITQNRMTVCGEQARLIANSTRAGVIMNVTAAAFAAGALLDSPLPWALVAGWFALLVAAVMFRVWVVMRCEPDGDPHACRRWLATFTLSTGAMGIAWGSLGLAYLLDPGNLPEALIVMCLIGVAGAVTASFGVLTRAAMAFAVPALLPLTAHYALHGLAGSIIGGVMAVLSIVYLALLYGVARRREASVGQAVATWERTHELAEQLRIIADYSYDWESWFTEDAQLLWVNPSVERITGYTPEECYQMEDYPLSIIHPDERSKVAAMLADWRRTREAGHIESRIVCKDGTVRWTAAEWQPALDSNGDPAGARVSVRDITDNVELREELERQASTDALTGLMNRRRFLEVCEGELYRAARFRRPVAVAMFDIDHFKRVNDTHGHAVGDLCLRAFVGAVRANIRQTDIFARFGGEEFTLLMPETELEEATPLCDRLREAVARASVTTTAATIEFTVSVGVTVCDTNETTIDAALSRADTALYAAKNQGRNRVKAIAALTEAPIDRRKGDRTKGDRKKAVSADPGRQRARADAA